VLVVGYSINGSFHCISYISVCLVQIEEVAPTASEEYLLLLMSGKEENL